MNKTIALDYVAAINVADIDKLYCLMSDDHIFIDAHDNRVIGRDEMKQGWIGYFTMFPDYKIEVNDVIERDSLICILGYAGGTYKNMKNAENSNYWRVPAAWTAIVEGDRVKLWQVYADNTFPIAIYNRNEKEPYPLKPTK